MIVPHAINRTHARHYKGHVFFVSCLVRSQQGQSSYPKVRYITGGQFRDLFLPSCCSFLVFIRSRRLHVVLLANCVSSCLTRLGGISGPWTSIYYSQNNCGSQGLDTLHNLMHLSAHNARTTPRCHTLHGGWRLLHGGLLAKVLLLNRSDITLLVHKNSTIRPR